MMMMMTQEPNQGFISVSSQKMVVSSRLGRFCECLGLVSVLGLTVSSRSRGSREHPWLYVAHPFSAYFKIYLLFNAVIHPQNTRHQCTQINNKTVVQNKKKNKYLIY